MRKRLSQTGLERRRGPDRRLDARRVEQRTFEVTSAHGAAFEGGGAVPNQCQNQLCELACSCGKAACDIDDAIPKLPGKRCDIGSRHVANEDVVAHAASIAGRATRVDAQAITASGAVEENGDDSGLTVRILTRAVDVRVAQHRASESAVAPIGIQKELERIFRDCVGTLRSGRPRLVGARTFRNLSIDCATGAREIRRL